MRVVDSCIIQLIRHVGIRNWIKLLIRRELKNDRRGRAARARSLLSMSAVGDADQSAVGGGNAPSDGGAPYDGSDEGRAGWKWKWDTMAAYNEAMSTMSVRDVFDMVDADGSGELDKDELRIVLTRPGDEPMSGDELEAIIAEFDADGNGVIDFEEFVVMWGERGTGGIALQDSEAAAAPSEPAAGSVALYVAREHLKMREGPELKSKDKGLLPAGSIVCVHEWTTLPNGVQRAHVFDPDDAGAANRGWVSGYARDGFENLRALGAEQRTMLGAIAHSLRMHRRATLVEALISLDMPAPAAKAASPSALGAAAAATTTTGGGGGGGGGGARRPDHRIEHELWLAAVRRCVLLTNLSAAEITFVSQATRAILAKPGDVLFAQGDPTAQVRVAHRHVDVACFMWHVACGMCMPGW